MDNKTSSKNKDGNVKNYNYANLSNIKDAQRTYEEEINKKRGIYSNTTILPANSVSTEETSRKSSETENKQTDVSDRAEPERRQQTYKENYHSPFSTESRDYQPDYASQDAKYNYSNTSNIKSTQREYEEEIDKRRGIHSNTTNEQSQSEYSPGTPGKKEEPGTAYSFERHDNFTKNAYDQTSEEKQTYQPDYANQDAKYNYTGATNILNAQREYEEETNRRRGIPAHRETNTGGDRSSGNISGQQGCQDHENQTDSNKNTVYVSRINNTRGINSENIAMRKIDLSELYEKSARGGAKNGEMAQIFGASEEDLEDLLSTRNLSRPGNIKYNVTRKIGNAASFGKTYLYESTTAGNDFGQGMRMMQDMAYPVAHILADRVLMDCHKAMMKDLPKTLNTLGQNVFGKDAIYIGNVELGISERDLKAIEKELINKLKEAGHGDFKGKGVPSQNRIKAFLRKNRNKLTENEVNALKMLLAVKKTQTIGDSIGEGRRRFRLKSYMRTLRYIQQTDAGAGLRFVSNFIQRGKMTLNAGLTLLQTTAKAAALAGKIAAVAAAKTAARLARTRLAQSVANTKVGEGVARSVRAAKNLKTRAKGRINNIKNPDPKSRFGKMKKSFEDKHKKFKAFRNDPFGLRTRKNNLLLKLKKSKAGRAVGTLFSPINFVKRMIGYAMATIMAIVATIISILLQLVLIFIVAILVMIVVTAVINSVISMFDFTASEEEIQKAAFKEIQESYEKQNKQIENLYGGQYRNVSVTYEDIKDEKEYQKKENQPDGDVTETTNSMELLSMATVYFDYDLEGAGKKKVVDYVRKLYNGSHLLAIMEKPVYAKDKDGKEYIAATDVSATLTTYYFNDLFDCQLSDSPGYMTAGTIGAGTTVNVPQDFSQCITVTLYDKWVNKWGVAPGTAQKKVSTEWTRQNQPFDNGWAYITMGGQKRYLIAVAETFGNVGDYVDVYFANGTVFPCIIADMKSTHDSNYTEWGHKTGNSISVIEGEVSTTAYKQYGNPGKQKWWPQLNSKVTKIVNGGSYFTNPEGPSKGVQGSGQLSHPCPGARISSKFGPRIPPKPGASSYHNGIDFAASHGTPILASDAGTVKTAKFNSVRGYYVVIDHGNGLETYYQHASKLLVKAGDTVTKGQQIAKVGSTGVSTGAHLHYEVHLNGKAVDPLRYL